jgi:hypothetical protein
VGRSPHRRDHRCNAIIGFVAILNAYEIPDRPASADVRGPRRDHARGLHEGYGMPYLGAAADRVAIDDHRRAATRLGRYIFATGGNPDAAALSGINTRLLTVKVFAVMGALCAISAVVASARLTFHSNDIGTLDELRVIAAAVIGGTALAGGIGTIYGAILGALIMQSLQSGMAMVGVDAPYPEHRRRPFWCSPSGSISSTASARETDHDRTPRLSKCATWSKSFGGIKAVDHVTVDLYPARWSACSATTAPANRC